MDFNRIVMTMMKTNLVGPFLLLVVLSSASGLGSVVRKTFSYRSWLYRTWHEAQGYCRSSGSDLAIIYSDHDKHNMHVPLSYNAWTSLHKDWDEDWVWADGQEHNTSWAEDQPSYSHRCAYVKTKKMYSTHCSTYMASFCQEGDSYIFINEGKMWSEAEEYCRTVYEDLATFKDNDDMDNAVTDQDYPIWIGLHRDEGTWKWSFGTSEYRNWASDESADNTTCVAISSQSRKMYTHNCTTRFPFFCFHDNLLLVKENLTWEEALLRCRNHNYELLSVQPGTEHIYVTTRIMEAETEEVWTSLHFLAGHWMWINKAAILYPDLPSCPDHSQSCGALSKNNTGSIELRDCTERKNVICYR